MAEPPPTPEPTASGPTVQSTSGPLATSSHASAASQEAKAAPKRNPAFAAMGLPRLRLPSRNWTIFLSIVAGWTIAVQYDRREKRIASEKWARLVRPLGNETLPVNALQRKLTVVLAAPPADGLMMAREHFHEYVKPVLVSASLDWEAVEGRKEGDVRAAIAEKLRKTRMMNGEVDLETLLEATKEDVEPLVEEIRDKAGIERWRGVEGSVVIGRHSWKEYVRGVHEGWLGPLKEAVKEQDKPQTDAFEDSSKLDAPTALNTLSPKAEEDDPLMLSSNADEASPTSAPTPTAASTEDAKGPDGQETTAENDKKKPKKRKQPDPFLTTSAYGSATPSKLCPDIIGPSSIIPEPHLLGFFNFPTRIYRYLTKRRLADDIGRQVAAAAMGHYRSFDSSSATNDSISGNDWSSVPQATFSDTGTDSVESSTSASEQSRLLLQEEPEWHKSVRKRDEDLPGKERVWLDDMVLDPRIASRMRRFELLPEDEAQARRIEDEIRKEKVAELWDIPSRIARGALITLGYNSHERGRLALNTVGDASEELD